MSRSAPVLIIDARPRGPSGLLAAEPILGQPVLAQLVELSAGLGPGRVVIHARPEDHSRLHALIPQRPDVGCDFAPGPPPESGFVLRTDRVYDPRRLRRAWRRRSDPERAVIWRLDSAVAIAGVQDEILRRRTFQPLGSYWALGPARALARGSGPQGFAPMR